MPTIEDLMQLIDEQQRTITLYAEAYKQLKEIIKLKDQAIENYKLSIQHQTEIIVVTENLIKELTDK